MIKKEALVTKNKTINRLKNKLKDKRFVKKLLCVCGIVIMLGCVLCLLISCFSKDSK